MDAKRVLYCSYTGRDSPLDCNAVAEKEDEVYQYSRLR